MSAVFRDALPSRPSQVVDATHARGWVSAGLALLTGVVVAAPPFQQTDWPSPARPLVPQSAVSSSSGSLPLTAAGPLPFSLTSWPLPAGRLSPPPETPPQNVALIRTAVVAAVAPFASFDWALANRLPPSIGSVDGAGGSFPVLYPPVGGAVIEYIYYALHKSIR